MLPREGFKTAQLAGDALAQSICCQTLGGLARRRGALAQPVETVAQFVAPAQPEVAARLLGNAAKLRDAYELSRTPQDRAWLDGWLADARLNLTDAVAALKPQST